MDVHQNLCTKYHRNGDCPVRKERTNAFGKLVCNRRLVGDDVVEKVVVGQGLRYNASYFATICDSFVNVKAGWVWEEHVTGFSG